MPGCDSCSISVRTSAQGIVAGGYRGWTGYPTSALLHVAESQQPAKSLFRGHWVWAWQDLTKSKIPLYSLTATKDSARCTAKDGPGVSESRFDNHTLPFWLEAHRQYRVELATPWQIDQHPIGSLFSKPFVHPCSSFRGPEAKTSMPTLDHTPCAARCAVPRAIPLLQTAGTAYPSLVKRLTFMICKPLKPTNCLASA